VKIIQITVSYGETQSLPEYSNVKPSLTLTATLDEGDNPAAVEATLWDLARASVHAQIDTALERNDRPAKYDPVERYQVLMTYWDRYSRPKDAPEPPKLVVILPNTMTLDRRGELSFVHAGNVSDSRKLRYAHALRVATEAAQERDCVLLDCADGDLTRLLAALPPLPAPPPSDEDVAGMRMADDREDDWAEDDEEDASEPA